MNKSTLTPKEIAKRRLARSKLMKLPLQERCIDNIEPIILPNIKKPKTQMQDKNMNEIIPRNPFDLPHLPIHDRMFIKKLKGKTKLTKPFVMTETQTICDLDLTFYTIIEGRPLRHTDDIKVYIRNLRDITLFKANASYIKEKILQFQSSLNDEMKAYDMINRLVCKTKSNFMQYLKDDFQRAKVAQELAKIKGQEISEKLEQLTEYSFECNKLRNEVSATFSMLENLLRFRIFLDKMVPVTSQQKYKNISKFESNIRFIMSSISVDMQTQAGLLEMVYDEVDTGRVLKQLKALSELETNLYFKNPNDLIQIFDNISSQCLNYMQIEVFSRNILATTLRSSKYLKTKITEEINEMKQLINTFESKVTWMEDKEKEYKDAFFKLLMNGFQELYSSYDNTKLFTCVQYVYNIIFKDIEDPKDNIVFLTYQLEKLYGELYSELENLNQNVVKAATKQSFAEDLKTMKKAFKAKRTMKESDILKKTLFTSFEPPRYNYKGKK